MQVYLTTERLILRRFTAADADLLFDLDSDPAVMRYLTGGLPTSRAVIEREILPRFLRSYEPNHGFGIWAAIERSTGDFLGWFSFRPHAGASAGEVALGYRLRRSVWGQGYATEGARALIRKGFTELGVERVVATTYQDNLASQRVMEKTGMTLVRTFRLTPADLAATGTFDASSQEVWDGEDVDYALERAEWERQEAARGERPATREDHADQVPSQPERPHAQGDAPGLALTWSSAYHPEWDADPEAYVAHGVVRWGRSRRLACAADPARAFKAYLGVQHYDPARWHAPGEPRAAFFLSLFRDGRTVTLRTFPAVPAALAELHAFHTRLATMPRA